MIDMDNSGNSDLFGSNLDKGMSPLDDNQAEVAQSSLNLNDDL